VAPALSAPAGPAKFAKRGRQRRPALSGAATLLLLVAALGGAAPSAASDRPFLITWRAVAEEDDDEVWEVEAVADAGRSWRSVSVEAEYAFDPLRSVQVEAGCVDNRYDNSVVFGLGWYDL
jgi:hypothetical protein